jgi:hypothetical protein
LEKPSEYPANMKDRQVEIEDASDAAIPNGAAAAAILSAGAGCFSLGICAWLGDAFPTLAHFFDFYDPTGPLSGVTTTAILFWLVFWVILSKAWGGKSLPIGVINIIAFLLLGMGVLLTFPPVGDLLQGK